MKYLFKIWLVIFSMNSFAEECGNLVDVEFVKKLENGLTLKVLNDNFGKWCQGHGPVSWYKASSDREVWFYWQMPKSEPTTESEINQYKVLVASVLNKNEEENQTIIWPTNFVGKDLKEILNSEYKTQ